MPKSGAHDEEGKQRPGRVRRARVSPAKTRPLQGQAKFQKASSLSLRPEARTSTRNRHLNPYARDHRDLG